ncbi:Ribonucleotide monophosphatase NagD [Pseudoruegeria aquimaris]|uniref:Ribonucleotide monophosphatase NagD n=1 Tax=Pseudoruegeria aquimaris TaxID=393663 RepID=A0A1Y5SRH8_9RHOB|nr:HAD hydrolase-like protein [Pseudoruegeria aquimaris]SLN46524.1 Ribonucleotide monophosphatase NagD [Pseudoruegeria aquimaris]
MQAAGPGIGPEWAFARYEAIRSRLPQAAFGGPPRPAGNLAELAAHFDGFILDAFGVLNRGETAIAGAVERMAQLRAMGKRLIVLTNAASYTRSEILAKYHRLGFDFRPEEVISSRDLAFAALPELPSGAPWGAVAAAGDSFEDAPHPVADLLEDASLWARAGGFLLLSAARWPEQGTKRLIAALRARPRPVVVANPDLVAPRESGLSIEPGSFAHALMDALPRLAPRFHGKPYAGAFDAAVARMGGIPRHRIAMVGDTLHTDILGGAAAGLGTVLVTDHGLFRGQDVAPCIARSGIRPAWIVPTT